jgi:ketosteroid isomerase-like protein
VSYEAGQLADLEEIKTLSYRYALGLDRFDIEGILSVFAPDGVFDMSSVGLPRMEGRESMREFFSQRTLQVMASQMHLFGNHVIEFDGADEAHATNYLFQDGYSKEGQRIQSHILNEDRYVRTADGWRISHRKLTALVAPQLEGF